MRLVVFNPDTNTMEEQSIDSSNPRSDGSKSYFLQDRAIARGQLVGQQRSQDLYGMSAQQVGPEVQDIISRRKQRMDTASPAASRALQMGNREIAQARSRAGQTGRKLSAGEESQIGRAAQQGASEFQWQAEGQGLSDYQKLVGNLASNMSSMELGYAQLGKAGDAPAVPAPNKGLMGTVICTELYCQNLMDIETYLKDKKYGEQIIATRPHVYAGYILWAPTVVTLMKKSKLFTKIVAIPALAWAESMSGKKNLFGDFVRFGGEFICGVIGIFFGGKNEKLKA